MITGMQQGQQVKEPGMALKKYVAFSCSFFQQFYGVVEMAKRFLIIAANKLQPANSAELFRFQFIVKAL